VLNLTSALLRRTMWLAFLFAITVLILATLNGLPAKISDWRGEAEQAEQLAARLRADIPELQRFALEGARKANADVARLQRASARELDAAERDVARRRIDAQARANPGVTLDAGRIVAGYRARLVELPLLHRTATVIALRRARLTNTSDVARYNAHVAAYNIRVIERDRLQRFAAAQKRYQICRNAVLLLGCENVRKVNEMSAALSAEQAGLRTKRADIETGRHAVVTAAGAAASAAAAADRVTNASDELKILADQKAAEVGTYSWNRTKDALRRHGWTAFLIVASATLLPIIH